MDQPSRKDTSPMSKKNRRKPAAATAAAHSETAERAREAGAELPKDHAAKIEANNGIYTVTVNGVTFDVEHAVINDYRLIDMADRGNPSVLFKAIVGDKHDEVLDALEDEHGRVPMERIGDLIKQVYEQVGQGNSSASPAS